jgi:hypothetical protein
MCCVCACTEVEGGREGGRIKKREGERERQTETERDIDREKELSVHVGENNIYIHIYP